MASQTNFFHCPDCLYQSDNYESVVRHVQICTEGSDDDAGVSAEEHADGIQHQEKAWSHEATLLLIEAYRVHYHGFSDRSKREYEVWQDISNDLQIKGYRMNRTACEQKMRILKRWYIVIKDNACLSGRGSLIPWTYFSAMDDLMAGDPTIVPEALESCFPIASTSGTQTQSAPTTHLEPLVCSTPSPSPSSTISVTPVHSPTPASEPLRRPQLKTYLETFTHQGKILEMLVSSQNERNKTINELVNRLGSAPREKSVEAENRELKQKIEKLQQQLFLQKDKHLRDLEVHNNKISDIQLQHLQEINEIQKQRHQEIMEMQKQHGQEINEMRQQHRQEINEMRQQHGQEINEMRQQHRQEIKEIHLQHQQHLLELILKKQ